MPSERKDSQEACQTRVSGRFLFLICPQRGAQKPPELQSQLTPKLTPELRPASRKGSSTAVRSIRLGGHRLIGQSNGVRGSGSSDAGCSDEFQDGGLLLTYSLIRDRELREQSSVLPV